MDMDKIKPDTTLYISKLYFTMPHHLYRPNCTNCIEFFILFEMKWDITVSKTLHGSKLIFLQDSRQTDHNYGYMGYNTM
jgi:hypothetical protein